jgi:hypothetical protein
VPKQRSFQNIQNESSTGNYSLAPVIGDCRAERNPDDRKSGDEMLDFHGISKAAFDLVVNEEVSGRQTYEARYRRPEVPGGQSGVTVGIGYDCGQTTAAIIRQDWAGKIPDTMMNALCGVAGLKAERAQRALLSIRNSVDVPWDAALDVFSNVSLPKYLRLCRALPHFDELSPDCKGVLFSLVYNRGASFEATGARYAEMRHIMMLMTARQFARIPAELRSMKRLWATRSVRGVALRREHEAQLFERGLAASGLVRAA